MSVVKATHTPGPWQVGLLAGREDEDGNDERMIEQYAGGPVIGTVWPMGEDFDGENECAEREANARLIAAAPELLALVTHIAGGRFAPSEVHHDACKLLARVQGEG